MWTLSGGVLKITLSNPHSAVISWCLKSALTLPLLLCVAAGGQRGGYALSALGEEEGEPGPVTGAAPAASRLSSGLRIHDSQPE